MNANQPNNRFVKFVRTVQIFGLCALMVSDALALPTMATRKKIQPQEPFQVLVKFRPGMAAAASLRASGYSTVKEIGESGVHVVTVLPSRTAEEVAAEMKSRYGHDLEYAEPDSVRYPAIVTPNPIQWHLPKITAPQAWGTTTGSGIVIAIADTGVDTSHPDLIPNLILPGYNAMDGSANVADEYGHGTAVAGTAAAAGISPQFITGVAYTAGILPIKIAGANGYSLDSTIATAIIYAADHGAKIVNVSFNSGLYAYEGGCWGQTVIDAASYMRSKGGLAVFAAGNGHNDMAPGIDQGCPHIPEFITVAATDPNDHQTSYSNYGAEIDVAAPGGDGGVEGPAAYIYTTECAACTPIGEGSAYGGVDGTSFAAPVTSAVLALIYTISPSFTADQAQQILFDSAVDLGSPGRDNIYGWGRVSASNAIGIAEQRSSIFQLESMSNVYAYPNPWDARKTANRQVFIANLPDEATVKIFTLSGFWVKTLQAGNGRAVWDLTNDSGSLVASGVYFYLASNGAHSTKGTIAIIK